MFSGKASKRRLVQNYARTCYQDESIYFFTVSIEWTVDWASGVHLLISGPKENQVYFALTFLPSRTTVCEKGMNNGSALEQLHIWCREVSCVPWRTCETWQLSREACVSSWPGQHWCIVPGKSCVFVCVALRVSSQTKRNRDYTTTGIFFHVIRREFKAGSVYTPCLFMHSFALLCV